MKTESSKVQIPSIVTMFMERRIGYKPLEVY